MDPATMLMLSNLLQLHYNLSPLFSDEAPPPNPTLAAAAASSAAPTPPPSSLLDSSASPAPILFLAFASALASAPRHRRRRPRRPSPFSLDPAARDVRYRSQFGVSYPVFVTLLETLSPHLAAAALPLSPNLALSVALSRLSAAASPLVVARRHRVPARLVARATNAVTRLLAARLYPSYVRVPAGHRLLQTVQAFRDLTSLPAVVGAVAAVPMGGTILVQAVADARKIFWDVCVRGSGSADPAAHLRDSLLYRRLAAGEILSDGGYILGDGSFPLLPFLMTPFGDGAETAAERTFDYAVEKGRAASVEAALGLLFGRWQILRELDGIHVDHAAQTVVACCVLHNICQIAGEPEDVPAYVPPPLPVAPPRAVDEERSLFSEAEALRRVIADDLFAAAR